ncbi:MAG: Tfp pilus assembly protein ATPase PilM [Chthonomonadales bacterium]|nr:Tfp pilus assembly protein ATPase PilM [Chthonomonadales bacterium]
MSSKASSQSAGSSVAFDLGANAIRVVEVEWSGSAGTGRLVRRGSAPLPVNAWNDLPANAAAFSAAIRQALSSAGISAKVVSASLPRRLVTLRFTRLPHAAPELMRDLVTEDAKAHVLFPIDEVFLDYHVSSESGGIGIPSEDELEPVLLAAARRSLILDLISIFEKAGLELDQLTVSALALAEHIRDSIEATAVIDIEPGEMDVAVVANRQLLFSRASGLDVTGAQPDIAARRLADEIARSFTSFQNEYRQQVLSHISLSGPSIVGADGFAIEQTLSSVLEMPITKLSGRLLPASDTDAIPYATALGVALQTRAGNLASINLVPDERAVKKAEAALRQRKQLVFVAGLAAVILGGVFIKNVAVAANKDRLDNVQANDKLKKFSKSVDAKRKVYQTRSALYNELNTGLDRNHPSVDVLVALNRALPQTTQIWLTQFAFDRNGLITLHGETKSAEAATEMAIALQDSGAFTDVKVAYLGDAQETTVVSSDAPLKAPIVPTSTPVTPLPPMANAGTPTAMANGPGGPGGYGRFGGGAGGTGGSNGGYGGGGYGGGGYQGANGQGGNFPGGGYGGGGQRNFPGPNGFQPGGQGGTRTFQPGQGFPGGAPTSFVIPNGAQIDVTPSDPNSQQPATKILRFDPNGGVLVTPALPPTPPPFYLIGYGQDPTNGQDLNGQLQDGTDATGQNGTGRRGRRQRGNNQGNGNQGGGNQGQVDTSFQAQGGANSTGTRTGRGNRGPRGSNPTTDPTNFNSAVTMPPPGSSNPVQPGTQFPQGGPPRMPGGPVINPMTAPVTRPVVVPPVTTRKPVVLPTAKPKATLTSFIITCRINPQARTLITSHGAAPAKGANHAKSSVTGATRRTIGEDSDTPDSSDNGGEPDGNP